MQETPPADPKADAEKASRILRIPVPVAGPPRILRALRLLAEQCTLGIDYKSLGLGWSHPTTRIEYRRGKHASFQSKSSLARSEESREALVNLVKKARAGDEGAIGNLESVIVGTFVKEVGLESDAEAAKAATFDAVLTALEAELVMPLRALNEGQKEMCRTFQGRPVPPRKVAACVSEITKHVLQGDFSEWRYSNPVGVKQLEGLSDAQIAQWKEPTQSSHGGGIKVHEDAAGELGLFWATKIGGPSHGFDIEGQCLLPLLANARHKVVLVSDPAWTHHPAGRAHFRLLWLDTKPMLPVLWLESINCDFAARVDMRPWKVAVVSHVVSKADAMGVKLSLDTSMQHVLERIITESDRPGRIEISSDKILLWPSNGVVEASDYLDGRHDWVQVETEIVGPHRRCVYTPSRSRSGSTSLAEKVEENPMKKRKI